MVSNVFPCLKRNLDKSSVYPIRLCPLWVSNFGVYWGSALTFLSFFIRWRIPSPGYREVLFLGISQKLSFLENTGHVDLFDLSFLYKLALRLSSNKKINAIKHNKFFCSKVKNLMILASIVPICRYSFGCEYNPINGVLGHCAFWDWKEVLISKTTKDLSKNHDFYTPIASTTSELASSVKILLLTKQEKT